ncbi:MAG: peptidylprolyl isomerase [Acidimicrobiaceae bacterium]|nr:peptidylprolyl isomerase [Acidimicrobiaceae bacterium]
MREIRDAQEERRDRRRKSIRRIVLLVVLAGAVIGIVFAFSGSSPKKPAAKQKKATTASAANTACPPASGSAKRATSFKKAPPICIPATSVFDATVRTDVGPFVIRLNASSGLLGVNNFVVLSRYHFYDGTVFHRVIQGFVVQGGDPTGTGTGGPGYSFTGNLPPASCTAKGDCYPSWTVALANSGQPSSDGSQFFVVLPGGGSGLSRNYTVIGKVVSGTAVVARIGRDGAAATDQTGKPKVLHRIIKVTVTKVG